MRLGNAICHFSKEATQYVSPSSGCDATSNGGSPDDAHSSDGCVHSGTPSDGASSEDSAASPSSVTCSGTDSVLAAPAAENSQELSSGQEMPPPPQPPQHTERYSPNSSPKAAEELYHNTTTWPTTGASKPTDVERLVSERAIRQDRQAGLHAFAPSSEEDREVRTVHELCSQNVDAKEYYDLWTEIELERRLGYSESDTAHKEAVDQRSVTWGRLRTRLSPEWIRMIEKAVLVRFPDPARPHGILRHPQAR